MMQDTPRISVVIPTHNRPEGLRNAIESLKEQTVAPEEYELIVVDDGSSPAVVLPEDFTGPPLVLVRLEGVERSAARNAGAAAAIGTLLMFIDDDMQVGPDFLECHLRAQKDWPGALVVGAIELESEEMTRPLRRFREKIESNEVPAARGLAETANFCAAGNCSIPRDSFRSVGGFDENMRSAEDQDLALRHTDAGGAIAFVPEAKAFHHDSARDIRAYCKRSEWGMVHLVPFMRRNPFWPDNATRAATNGPIRFGREPLGQSLRKIAKFVAGRTP
ncbi:MAG TPA: glycosyltransferase, partial [Blastocatellia bacterium]